MMGHSIFKIDFSETPSDSIDKLVAAGRVLPTPSPNPKLCLWSDEVAADLGLDQGEGDVLGGGKTRDQQAFGTCLLLPPTSLSPGVSERN